MNTPSIDMLSQQAVLSVRSYFLMNDGGKPAVFHVKTVRATKPRGEDTKEVHPTSLEALRCGTKQQRDVANEMQAEWDSYIDFVNANIDGMRAQGGEA